MKPSWQIQSSSSSARIHRWQMMSIAHFHICKAQRPIEQLIVLLQTLLHSNTPHHWRPVLIPLTPHHTHACANPNAPVKRTGLEEPKHDRHTTQPADFNSWSAGTRWFLIWKCKFNGSDFLNPVGNLIWSLQSNSRSRHPVRQRPEYHTPRDHQSALFLYYHSFLFLKLHIYLLDSFWKQHSLKCHPVKREANVNKGQTTRE